MATSKKKPSNNSHKADMTAISDKFKELMYENPDDTSLVEAVKDLNRTLKQPIDLTRDLLVGVSVDLPVRAEAQHGAYEDYMSDEDCQGICDQVEAALKKAGIEVADATVHYVDIK